MTDQDPDPTSQVSALVESHVREIVAGAERAAAELQQEVEDATATRASELLAEAQADADAIRADAERQADHYLQDAQRRATAFADGRIARLHELSDELIARAEAIDARLSEVRTLQTSVDDLVAALTSAAHQAAAESSRPPVRIPRMDATPPPLAEEDAVGEPTPAAITRDPRAAGPASVALAKDADDDPTAGAVREAARDLPRLPRRPLAPTPPPLRPEDGPA